VLDLLGHFEREGFAGAPRALGFDDQGREVLTYIEGEAVFGEGFVPDRAFIDWDTATPGPRAWDLGLVAWRFAPFWRDEKCRAHGIPTGVIDKARRFRLLPDAYGVEPHVDIVQVTIDRMRDFWERVRKSAIAGSAWELELSRRGVLDEGALEIAWMEDHAEALVEA
jgi:hypothetical protein